MVNMDYPNRGWATEVPDLDTSTYVISVSSGTSDGWANTYIGSGQLPHEEEDAKEERDRKSAAKSREMWAVDRKSRQFRQRKWSWNKPK